MNANHGTNVSFHGCDSDILGVSPWIRILAVVILDFGEHVGRTSRLGMVGSCAATISRESNKWTPAIGVESGVWHSVTMVGIKRFLKKNGTSPIHRRIIGICCSHALVIRLLGLTTPYRATVPPCLPYAHLFYAFASYTLAHLHTCTHLNQSRHMAYDQWHRYVIVFTWTSALSISCTSRC